MTAGACLGEMKALLLLLLATTLVGASLRATGVPLPIIDYPIAPAGIFDGRGPAVPDVQIEPPGFGDFPAP